MLSNLELKTLIIEVNKTGKKSIIYSNMISSLKKIYPNTIKIKVFESVPVAILQEKKKKFIYTSKGKNINLLKPKEVIIVDGSSTDNTRKILKNLKIIKTKASRGTQLKKGAKHSKQEWLFFIHADTKLHIENIKEIKCFINKENIYIISISFVVLWSL